jgi:phosphotransferase system IIA component
MELLLHIGIDTVHLNGEGFTLFVKIGDIVTVGMKLAEVNLQKIIEYGKSIVTPMVVTNPESYDIDLTELLYRLENHVEAKNTKLFTVHKNLSSTT